ncbi:HAD family hydrolase [Methanosalsum natronophilum]|uniref:HAD family hydrolase n=1 Tax=Methanosalsum natronophilum TaxID=768733 RepID=UPI002169743B|nr:HAD family hydrolase [Methanosalsum natronophilum]MCS3924014.1 Cu+-exporting ATPase [Methanosalsum natronophilum]
MGKIAVVFDSSGTLMKMYRVVKNLSNDQLYENVDTITLVAKNPYRALLLIDTNPKNIVEECDSFCISSYIHNKEIPIEISYSTIYFSKAEANKILKLNKDLSIKELKEVILNVKNRCKDSFYIGSGLILNKKMMSIEFTVCTGGIINHNVQAVINHLQDKKVCIYIASGDSMNNLTSLARNIDIPINNVLGLAGVNKKEEFINKLKDRYEKVLMVGDGCNDVNALKSADLGILIRKKSNQTPIALSQASDYIVSDIIEILPIVDSL